MQVCTSLQADNHASTSTCRPTNSVKALKAQPGAVVIGTESMQIQRAHCRFPGLAIYNAEILTYHSKNIRKQFYQTTLGNCYGLKLPKVLIASLRKKF